MKLLYSLVELFLPNAQKKYRAQVHNQQVLTLEGLAKRMANKHTAFSLADINGLIELMRSCLLEAIQEGYAVDSILGMLRYSIQGSFENQESTFDRSRHTVKANLRLYPEFLETLSKMPVEKIKTSVSGPQITSVRDGIDTEAENDTLKPGGVAKIFGSDLKIAQSEDEHAQDAGIFLVHSDRTETKASMMIDNYPSRLTFLIPSSLAAGNYTVAVRTYYSDGRIVKKIMKGEYNNTVQLVGSETEPQGS